jgi:hypothetical protein
MYVYVSMCMYVCMYVCDYDLVCLYVWVYVCIGARADWEDGDAGKEMGLLYRDMRERTPPPLPPDPTYRPPIH